MTYLEFSQGFALLSKAYEAEVNPLVAKAYYHQLKGNAMEDWEVAVTTIPANERRGLPPARTMQAYMDDARAQRLYSDVLKQSPKTLENLYDLYSDQTPPEPERAYARVCKAYIDWKMAGGPQIWQDKAKACLETYGEWLNLERNGRFKAHLVEMAGGRQGTAKIRLKNGKIVHTGRARQGGDEAKTWLQGQCGAPGCLSMGRVPHEPGTVPSEKSYYCRSHREMRHGGGISP